MKKRMTENHRLRLLLVGTGLLLGMSAMTARMASAGADNRTMPDGATLLETRCSVCHSADRPKRAHKSPDQWEQTVARMIGKGAQLSATEKSVLIEHLSKGDVFSNLGVISNLHPQLFHHPCFISHDVSRQPVVRNPDGRHPARLAQPLKNGHGIAFEGKVIGTGEACRARADDGHFF